MSTVARLRAVLAPRFPEVATVLTRFREAGLIAAGAPGYAGAGSAPISPAQAIAVILALGSGLAPARAPAASQALSGYVLRAAFLPTTGPSYRTPIAGGLSFGPWAAAELRRAAADPNHRLAGWQIEAGLGIFTVDPVNFEPGGLREFGAAQPALAFEPLKPGPRPEAWRCTIIAPGLLRAVAAVYRGSRLELVEGEAA